MAIVLENEILQAGARYPSRVIVQQPFNDFVEVFSLSLAFYGNHLR